MEAFLELVAQWNEKLNNLVWGPYMLVLLVGTGVFLSILTGFLQVNKFGYAMKKTIGSIFTKKERSKKRKGGITSFQALTTALASTVGVGNIAGVATAIVSGGPGAVFWMWVSAFFGMVTKYSEVLLAVKYSETVRANIHYGGPMYYIEKGLKMKWLAVAFASFGTLACFGIGNMTQANEIANSVNASFGINPLITGIIIAFIVAMVIVGGIKRISRVTEIIVPFMALFFIIGGVIALIINAAQIQSAFGLIFSHAFSFKSAAGGAAGYTVATAMRYGVARGVFSNEAGLGSAPIAHAAANTNSPVEQALWGIFEVFVDTIIICTITALTILTTDLWTTGTIKGSALTSASFGHALGQGGSLFIAIAIIFFALSTILGWSYYGESCLTYLTKGNKSAIGIYKILFILFIVVGATRDLKLVWDIADTLNGMMAVPNLIALICLSDVVVKTTKEYFLHKNNDN